MLDEDPEEVISLGLGNKLYEMSNHLGNVLTVINDIKVPQSSNSVDVDGYLATIVSTADYSPFGVQLDGRTVSASSYRYGFQGQEKDDEIKGAGNSVNYTFRMHDTRLGRFFAIDPLASKYPHNSPYAFSENRLLDAIELEGLEAYFIHGTKKAWGTDWSKWVHSKQMSEHNLRRIGNVFGNTTVKQDFNWSGKNSDAARQQAGEELALHILETRTGDEPITLVAHSHGGNVAIAAANILIEKHGIPADQINIVAINTPREYDIELRHNNVNLFAVSAYGDLVQTYGSDAAGIMTSLDEIHVKNRDALIMYSDQIEGSWDNPDLNHYGVGTKNIDVWLPLLEAKKKELDTQGPYNWIRNFVQKAQSDSNSQQATPNGGN